MSRKSTSGFGRLVVRQLSHPIKLRVALCLGMIVAWQALFFGPLGEDVAATTARIERERRRTATAGEIEQLKKAQAPLQGAVGPAEGVSELIHFVVARIRSSPVRLVDLLPGKAKDVGPFQAISLQLKINGTYKDIDELLGWAESNPRLLRVDSILMKPNSREPGRLAADVTLVALAEKAPPAPAKAEAKASARPRPKSPPKPTAKPAPKATAKPDPKAAPKPNAGAASKAAPRPSQEPATGPGPRPGATR